MKFKKVIGLSFLIVPLLFGYGKGFAAMKDTMLAYQQGDLIFEWNIKKDQATLTRQETHHQLWHGSLLPSFRLEIDHQIYFVQAALKNVTAFKDLSNDNKETGYKKINLHLQVGDWGTGELLVTKEDWGIRFVELKIKWRRKVPAIMEMYYGASNKELKHSLVGLTWDRPFMPDWQSLLYCVPGAKGGTPQSYFRMWDFGQANIALGNFGPSMGSPYGAAYPRPLYYMGMGDDDGFIAFGAGAIPDAAMSLRIQSTRGCLEYVYNEDIWGALAGKERIWKEPLRITLGNNAWLAFKQYYNSFPGRHSTSPPPTPFWNTWGMWGQGKYALHPLADFAEKIGAKGLVLDDGWQASQGCGVIDSIRFPHFQENIQYIHEKRLEIGLWESVGWIADPYSNKLDNDDLILNKAGKPCKANWNFDPSGTSYYCLDISSSKTRAFIRQRTIRLMKTLKPALLKLDFSYGLPSPAMGVPRNPRYRGEQYGYSLFHLIASTAKKVNPDIIIEGYSISPLWLNDIDMVSMDDQGDLWYDVSEGHQQWSIWASLLSDKNISICGSSGYQWFQDKEVVLNSCILGVPGAVLPVFTKEEQPIEDTYFNRRLAINTWYRRQLQWTPVWFNSHLGGYTEPMRLRCWGRKEFNGNDSVLAALVLREDGLNKSAGWVQFDRSGNKNQKEIQRLRWRGRWALISQDDQDVFSTTALAIIPFDSGALSVPLLHKPIEITRLNRKEEKLFHQWKWDQGLLFIEVSDSLLHHTAGFLIKTRP